MMDFGSRLQEGVTTFCGCAFFLNLISLAPAAQDSAHPPNIIFILADDLGWADLGCYGNKFNETLNIDRLASQGVKFTQFYAAGAVCSPTRASIMSGQYQARFGLTAHIHGHWKPFEKLAEPPCALTLPTNLVSIAKKLRDAGYATAMLGKWHLDWKGKSTPKEHGFETVVDLVGHTVAGTRQEPPSATPKRAIEYLADRAIQFMETNRGKPFFLYLCPSAVHIPLTTTPQLQKKYESKPKVAEYSCHPLYAGLLEEMDISVGRVIAALERLGLADNSLVIFTSDNGGLEREVGGWPGTLNRPLRNEKGSLYEGGIRVPLIIRWPGVGKAGATTDAVAISTDFYPTFLEAARSIRPRRQILDGISLLTVLGDPAKKLEHQPIFWHYPHYHHSRPSSAVRVGNYKAIEFFDTGEIELYDLAKDLSESNNLAASMPALARAMRERLHQWRQEVNAQMPQENPAYDPKRADEWWNRSTIKPTEAPGTYAPVPEQQKKP